MLAVFICLISLSEAFATGISAITNGFYLVIAGDRPNSIGVITNEPIRFDDRLLWMPFCDTREIELSYPADPAYRMKIKMTDTNGNELPKTALGKTFGSKFDSLRSFTDTRPYPFIVGGAFKDNPSLGGARFLPTPKDLIQIEKTGIYTLEIQMQMFYSNPQSTNALHKDLFQFSPVTIKVEKPPDK